MLISIRVIIWSWFNGTLVKKHVPHKHIRWANTIIEWCSVLNNGQRKERNCAESGLRVYYSIMALCSVGFSQCLGGNGMESKRFVWGQISRQTKQTNEWMARGKFEHSEKLSLSLSLSFGEMNEINAWMLAFAFKCYALNVYIHTYSQILHAIHSVQCEYVMNSQLFSFSINRCGW